MKLFAVRSVKVAFAGLLVIMSLLAMIAPAHAVHVTITPSSADTYVYESGPGVNYGTATFLYVLSEAGFLYRSLVKFDLSSIPSGSTITAASLQLYYFGGLNNGPVGRTYTANRVTTNWVETTATWNTYDGTHNWGTAGGDFTVTDAASSVVPASFGYMTWDVTAIVKAWIDGGQSNYGFLMKDLNENSGNAGAEFYSREQGSNMPVLEIDYTAPVPSGPVGGFIMPVNKVAVFAPYLALLGVIGVVAVVVWKRPDN